MPGPPTPLLGLIPPTVRGDINIWGTELNNDLALIDNLASSALLTPTSGSNVNLTFSPNLITVYQLSAGASSITATLPAAGPVNTGRFIYVMKVDAGAGFVIVAGTINGSANYLLVQQWQYVKLMFNGVTWNVFGGN